MVRGLALAGLALSSVARGAPLPEAWAPFERTEPARREVSLAAFDYRTGPVWRPSAVAYPWAEFVAGDKSMLIGGTDRRVQGMGPAAAEVTANGFGHIVFYAGKRELRKPGTDFLAEIRFLVKTGGPWNEGRKGDALVTDEAAGTATFTRPWTACGTNGVFTYTARADGKGCAEVVWDVGVDAATWQALKLGDKLLMFLRRPNEEPSSGRSAGGSWEFAGDDPARHVSVTMTPPGPQGRITVDFHESTAYRHPPLPKVGGIDFWLTDAYDVPVKPGRNQMMNGGFEQGFKGWRFNRGAPVAAVTNSPGEKFTTLTTDAKFGRYALKMSCPPVKGDRPAYMSAPMALTPGRTYTVSCWAKSDRKRGGGISMSPNPEGSMVKQVWPGKAPNCCFGLDDDWKRCAVTFVASEQGTRINFYPWGGPILIDGVMVEEGPSAGETEGDPVEARLESAAPCNYLRSGTPFGARVALTGRPGLSGKMRVSVENLYHERVYVRDFAFRLDDKGFGSVGLDDLTEARTARGVFSMRFDFSAAGLRWHDFQRFTVIDPLDGTQPLAGFIAHFPWFAGGGAYMFTLSPEFADEMGRRMVDWGVGATSWASNRLYSKGYWADFFRKFGVVDKHHNLMTDLRDYCPERFGWGKPGLSAMTNATPEELSFIEESAYRSAKDAHPSDVYWCFANEEELWHPLIKGKRDFDTYFKYQYACWKGLKRGFDERGLKFLYAPTHGTSAYSHESSRSILDGYLTAAAKQGFRYDCISIHMYHAVDGSVLGAGDRDANAEYLVRRLRDFGYGDETPILFPEGFNVMPYHIPAWGASDWADCYHGKIPSHAFSNREALHAGCLMRIYLMDLKHYPRLKVVHTWQRDPVLDIDFAPYLYTSAMNALGHLLPDPRFVGEAKPYPDVRGYCYRRSPGSDECVLAVWTTNNDVENGLRKGDVLTMDLPSDARFADIMGNPRTAPAGPRTAVPMTPYPLYILSRDGAALVKALREAQGGTSAGRTVREAVTLPARAIRDKSDWADVRAVPLTNGVPAGVSAAVKLGWASGRVILRVAVRGMSDPVLDVAIDGLADARETVAKGPGPDDCAYRFAGDSVKRTRETNTQFRDGGASGTALTDEEIDRTLVRHWKPAPDGGLWEIELTPRLISPVRAEKGVRFGLGLKVSSAGGSAALAPSDDPASYPVIELK